MFQPKSQQYNTNYHAAVKRVVSYIRYSTAKGDLIAHSTIVAKAKMPGLYDHRAPVQEGVYRHIIAGIVPRLRNCRIVLKNKRGFGYFNCTEDLKAEKSKLGTKIMNRAAKRNLNNIIAVTNPKYMKTKVAKVKHVAANLQSQGVKRVASSRMEEAISKKVRSGTATIQDYRDVLNNVGVQKVK